MKQILMQAVVIGLIRSTAFLVTSWIMRDYHIYYWGVG